MLINIKTFIWNIRGFGNKPRRGQIKDYCRKEGVDIIGLQETIKQSFEKHELESLVGGAHFSWHWLPAIGHSGGILLGANEDKFQVEVKETGSFLCEYDFTTKR